MAARFIRFDFKSVRRLVQGVSFATALVLCVLLGGSVAQATIVSYNLDFETEDDFVTPLVNGQSISTFPDVQDAKGNFDTVFEFGNLVNISTSMFGSCGHEGAAIFDSNSTPGGPNVGGPDPDLLVNKGNILILQNNSHPDTGLDATYGLTFDVPDDEVQYADFGAIIFDFTMPVEVTSIDLIDVDDNCRYLMVLMTDENGNERMYEVPSGWTNDVTWGTKGWHTLDLTDPYDQPGDIGTYEWTAAWEDDWFDPYRVIQLEIMLDGSAAIDNLRFNKYIPIPEPSSLVLFSLSGLTLLGRRRRDRIWLKKGDRHPRRFWVYRISATVREPVPLYQKSAAATSTKKRNVRGSDVALTRCEGVSQSLAKTSTADRLEAGRWVGRGR